MKKIIFAIVVTLTLAACSSKPPPPIEPKGEFTPVNPSEINLSDLKL